LFFFAMAQAQLPMLSPQLSPRAELSFNNGLLVAAISSQNGSEIGSYATYEQRRRSDKGADHGELAFSGRTRLCLDLVAGPTK